MIAVRSAVLAVCSAVSVVASWFAGMTQAGEALLPEFTATEINRMLSHGPWPMPWAPDASNRVSGNGHAVDLGERLFFERRLSGRGNVSCATCHMAERHWSDGVKRNTGFTALDRNTPSLMNQRHFGEFKVPSLRNVGYTGPYMHNGEMAALSDVVRHYAELNVDRLHADGESILKPLKLTPSESTDLVAFLQSLNSVRVAPRRGKEPARPPCG